MTNTEKIDNVVNKFKKDFKSKATIKEIKTEIKKDIIIVKIKYNLLNSTILGTYTKNYIIDK